VDLFIKYPAEVAIRRDRGGQGSPILAYALHFGLPCYSS
jgi:hypothetical protein